MCVNILETLIVQARKRGVVLGPLGQSVLLCD